MDDSRALGRFTGSGLIRLKRMAFLAAVVSGPWFGMSRFSAGQVLIVRDTVRLAREIGLSRVAQAGRDRRRSDSRPVCDDLRWCSAGAAAVGSVCRRARFEVGAAPASGVHEPPEDVAGGEDPDDVDGVGAVQAVLRRLFWAEGVHENRRAGAPSDLAGGTEVVQILIRCVAVGILELEVDPRTSDGSTWHQR